MEFGNEKAFRLLPVAPLSRGDPDNKLSGPPEKGNEGKKSLARLGGHRRLLQGGEVAR
jgi:hypothetical protein